MIRPSRMQPGFTLVEMLIALALVGMLVVLGQQALHAVIGAGRALAGDPGADAVATEQLRGWLAGAIPLRSGPGDADPVIFEGRSDAVWFVTLLPRRFGQAGPHLVAVGPGPDRTGLRMGWMVQADGAVAPDPSEGRVTLAGMRGLQVRYFDPAAAGWVEEWVERPDLPAAIRMTGRLDGEAWQLVVRPRLETNRQSGRDGR